MPNNYSCSNCKNSNCLIRKHYDSESIQSFIKEKTAFRCNAEQQFILEGTPVSGLYFIYEGNVKVYRETANRESQIIRLSKDGEIVGHRGFGTNYKYDISASALSDCVLCHFPTETLIEMLHKKPELMFDFMLFYADQLQKSEANAKRFSRMSVKDKVINGLLFIYHKFGQTEGIFNITLSRKDIADFAGTAPDQVARVISSLKKEGFINAKGRKLGLAKPDELEESLGEDGYFLEG